MRTVFCLDVVIGFQIFRVGPRQRLFCFPGWSICKNEKTRSDGDQKHRQNKVKAKETTVKHMYNKTISGSRVVKS